MLKEKVSLFEEEEEEEEIDNDVSNREKLIEEISKIIVSGSDWTTATIIDQIERGNIQLNPKFQRRDAWNITRKSRFIESLLLGFPIPQIVLATNPNNKGKFIVIDGKQRLLSLLQFYAKSESKNNGFTLKDMEFKTELNGHNYNDLRNNSLSEIDALENQTIRTILIRNWHREDLLDRIFYRLNLEITPLSPQELRRALHPGIFVDFIDDQSVKINALRKIFKSSEPDPRMRDFELLLRYVGFHYFLSEYQGNLQNFLDKTCEKLNRAWEKEHDDIENVVNQFDEAVQTTINIFGENNFSRMWLSDSNRYESKFNRAILDVMVFYFSDKEIRESADRHRSAVEEGFKNLFSSNNNEFREAIQRTTNNIRKTYNRLGLWGNTLLDVLDVKFNIPQLVDNRIVFKGLR